MVVLELDILLGPTNQDDPRVNKHQIGTVTRPLFVWQYLERIQTPETLDHQLGLIPDQQELIPDK